MYMEELFCLQQAIKSIGDSGLGLCLTSVIPNVTFKAILWNTCHRQTIQEIGEHFVTINCHAVLLSEPILLFPNLF